MQNRLLIIDGHNLLFQMFFGLPTKITGKDNKPINAVLGFVGGTIKLINMLNPTHIIAIFDGEHENERTEILPEYKANRTDYSLIENEEDNPFSQLDNIYSALQFMGIKYYETVGYEADDLISSYVSLCKNDYEIYISSFDSDFFQLIDENVFTVRYRGKSSVICDRNYIKDKFGISPEQYADFKSLTGDTADNIKGASQVGPKTASSLLNEFQTLENVLENAENITKPSVRNSILQSKELLRNNYKLIKLGNNAEISLSPEKLAFAECQLKTMDILFGIGIK